MGLLKRSAAVAPSGPVYHFGRLPEPTRQLTSQLFAWCERVPDLLPHCEDLFEEATHLNRVMATLVLNEQEFLRRHATRTRHSYTPDGKAAISAMLNNRPQPAGGYARVFGFTTADVRAEAERLHCFWSTSYADAPRSVFAMGALAALAARQPGAPRARTLKGRLLSRVDRMIGFEDVNLDPLLTRYFAWEQPEGIAAVVAQSQDLREARGKVLAEVADLHGRLEGRRAEMTRYEMLDEVGRRAVDSDLQAALAVLTSADYQAGKDRTNHLTAALRSGVTAASLA